jgi:uncharacterized protein YoxC
MIGDTVIEDSLQRLDGLTQEARMLSAELLEITHGIEVAVQDVRGNVQDVGHKIERVDDGVRNIGSDVEDIVNEVRFTVRSVDDKLDKANCSYFPIPAHHLKI